MKKFKCIIIEDNIVEQKILETHLIRLPFIEIVAVFSNPIDTIALLHEGNIDLLFSDIELPEINGLAFIKTLSSPPKVIILTSHSNYALDAFEIGIVDYIVKPYTFERIMKAVSRAIETKTAMHNSYHEEPFIFLKVGRDLMKFMLPKIDYFEAYGSFTKIYYDGKVTTLSEPISILQDKLPINAFIRVHKSFLVSKEKIVGISSKIVHLEKFKIPLGISYREEVEKKLGSS